MFIIIAFVTTATLAGAKPKILLTTFEPFQGPTNSSQAVAAELAKLNTPDAPVTYEVCALPTEYDRSFKRAKECFDRSNPKPSAVLSLGESTDKLKVETVAKNQDDDIMPDNAGVTREKVVIEANGPAEVAMTLPIEEMLCASDQFGDYRVAKYVTPSISMQNYVCNNLAFRMARYLKPRGVPFGFLHVPNQRTFLYAENPARVAERIARMVKTALVPGFQTDTKCEKSRLKKRADATLSPLRAACRNQVRRQLSELRKAARGEPSEEAY